jgi:hypothetical protein
MSGGRETGRDGGSTARDGNDSPVGSQSSSIRSSPSWWMFASDGQSRCTVHRCFGVLGGFQYETNG